MVQKCYFNLNTTVRGNILPSFSWELWLEYGNYEYNNLYSVLFVRELSVCLGWLLKYLDQVEEIKAKRNLLISQSMSMLYQSVIDWQPTFWASGPVFLENYESLWF